MQENTAEIRAIGVCLGKGNRVLYRQGDPISRTEVPYCYRLLEGTVLLERTNIHGKTVTIVVSTRGEFFGEEVVLDTPHRRYTAKALSDAVLQGVEITPELQSDLMTSVLKRCNLLEDLFSLRTVEERLDWVLKQYPSLPYNQALISRVCGVSREMVSRVLRKSFEG